MYGRADYAKQTIDGQLDCNTGIFTTSDGKKWQSIGGLGYGNNQDFEVMALATRPTEFDQDFRYNQFPIYISSHDGEGDLLGEPLPEYLAEVLQSEPHHLNAIIEQIGGFLAHYTKNYAPQ